MGYKIRYRSVRKTLFGNPTFIRLPLLVLLFIFLFATSVVIMWPEGYLYLRNVRLFSDAAVTVSALNDFAEELRNGQSVVDTFINAIGKLIS